MREMYRVFLIFVSLVFIHISANAQKKIPPEKPKLIIGIVVEQMRYDYLFRYWDKFGENGFKKLIDGGTFCKNAGFNYLFTQSDVGQATISTGSNPSSHGVIANEWYNRLKKEMVKSVYDLNEKTVEGSYESGKMSPDNLLSSTFQDELRISNNRKSKVFGVSLNPASAILSSGMIANAAYWFDVKNGTWISSTCYMDSLPDWVRQFNDKAFSEMYLTRNWNTFQDIEKYTESLPDLNEFETGIHGQTTFPYNLDMLSKKNRNKRDYKTLLYTPFGNDFTKDFAIHTIVNEELGKDEFTDVLTVSFSAMNYIGKSFGPSSVEIEDAYLRLDKNIAHFLQFIDNYAGKENVLIYLTSNHGVAHIPKYLQSLKMPVGYFNARNLLVLLKSYLNALYGKGDWIQAYYSQQLYLNRDLIEDSGIDLEEMQNKVAQFIIQFDGVANTMISSTLLKTNYTEGAFKKIQNSFNQKRSGDIIIHLQAGWIEKDEFSTSSNSANEYDTHVPLIWYGWKIKRKTIITPVEMTDIAPTISFFLNISYPSACTGKPILELIE